MTSTSAPSIITQWTPSISPSIVAAAVTAVPSSLGSTNDPTAANAENLPDDGLLMLATLFSSMILTAIIHVVYYKIPITCGASPDITAGAFEMTDGTDFSTGHDLRLSSNTVDGADKCEQDGQICARSTQLDAPEGGDGEGSVYSMRSSKSRRSRKRRTNNKASVDSSALLIRADQN